MPASGRASVSLRKKGRANRTRISPPQSLARNCPNRAGRWWRRSPTESAAPKAAASPPRPPCAAFSTDFGTCRRPWRCAAPAARVINALNGWIYAMGREDPELDGDGVHLHGARAARPGRPPAAYRRHARLPAEARPSDLSDRRSRAGGRPRPVTRAHARARRGGGGAAGLRGAAGRPARPLPLVQRRRARVLDR